MLDVPDTTLASLPTEITLADAARLTIEQDFVRLSDATSVADWSDDEARLKAARIGGRRLRSTLQIVGPYLEPKVARRLVRELDLLTSALGTVRDVDVLIALVRQAVEHDERLNGVNDLLASQRLDGMARVQRRITSNH